ncbi:hypothetical protein BH09PSE4_BH09PSE4_13840 [soil metagenome]
MSAKGHPNWGYRKVVTCAATRCIVEVPRGHLMCRHHWLSLPEALRVSILETFTAGQIEPYQTYVRDARDMIDAREFAPLFPKVAR